MCPFLPSGLCSWCYRQSCAPPLLQQEWFLLQYSPLYPNMKIDQEKAGNSCSNGIECHRSWKRACVVLKCWPTVGLLWRSPLFLRSLTTKRCLVEVLRPSLLQDYKGRSFSLTFRKLRQHFERSATTLCVASRGASAPTELCVSKSFLCKHQKIIF